MTYRVFTAEGPQTGNPVITLLVSEADLANEKGMPEAFLPHGCGSISDHGEVDITGPGASVLPDHLVDGC